MTSSMPSWVGMAESATPFQVHGQEFNSFRRRTRAKRLRDFGLHRQEEFQYTLGAIDQWEWEVRVIDQQTGAAEDKTPVCVGGRGATPPQYSRGPTGYRLMLKRQEIGEKMFPPAEVETVISMLTASAPRWTGKHVGSAEGCDCRKPCQPGSTVGGVWTTYTGSCRDE